MKKQPTATPTVNASRLRDRLLGWYDSYGRDLPWRSKGGKRTDPYRVWLSEIMLQQTTIATVVPYYHRFLSRWPNLAALAAAELDEVLHAWQGLGYYSRARNLHKCARVLCADYGGVFPDTDTELRKLPGIGPYTSDAIAAIAFDRPRLPVDGNVERVLARIFAVEEPLPAVKPKLCKIANDLATSIRPGDYAQAIMDLGATVCTVRDPNCRQCPWQDACRGLSRGLAAHLPHRVPKPPRPVRYAVAYIITSAAGDLYLERRPDGGLLGGLMQVPLSPWLDRAPTRDNAAGGAPIAAAWRLVPGIVEHGFTHFAVRITLLSKRAKRRDLRSRAGLWCAPDRLGEHALSTMAKKIIRHAASEGAIDASAGHERERRLV